MEENIVERMKLNKEVIETFTSDELLKFLSILSSANSDAKRQELFIKLIKGEKN